MVKYGGKVIHPLLFQCWLAHRFRRWPNIETALGECPVFGGQVLALRIFCYKPIYVPDVDAVGEPT